MLQSLTAFGVAFLFGLVLSRTFRRSLSWLYSRERKAGKEKIHRLFPKPRRPLGGGLAIMLATSAALLGVPLFWSRPPAPEALWMLPPAWGYALLGLLDDLKKVEIGRASCRERV
jgi:UDP-N-acetylmuramyl pentapeptide phosphotransferase/UDP-N-acetylglucosamine-1-phosphate transferase